MAKVEGTDKLRRKLTKFPKAAKFEIERAMIKGAREMVSMAKRMAPVKTGALRDSIQWNFAEDSPAYASLKGRTGGKPSSPDDGWRGGDQEGRRRAICSLGRVRSAAAHSRRNVRGSGSSRCCRAAVLLPELAGGSKAGKITY
jgi:hypothetical protein